MKSTHNQLHALAKGLALAFLLVTGAATMMGVFSSTTPVDRSGGIFPVSAVAASSMAAQQPSDDSVLYQRITQTNGSRSWVLLEEAQALAFYPASRDLLMAESPTSDTGSISRVSYVLHAKPAGWQKVLKNCAQIESGKPIGSAAAYNIACSKLG